MIGGAASATAAGGWKKTMARRGKGTWCRSREKGDDVEAYVDDDEDDGDKILLLVIIGSETALLIKLGQLADKVGMNLGVSRPNSPELA